jgi:hypothetical protein
MQRMKGFTPIACVFLLVACGTGSSDSAVSRDLRTFYETFVGRELSSAEARAVAAEFTEIHSLNGRSPEEIRGIARNLATQVEVLRAGESSPVAASARHRLLEANYLNPDLHDTIQLRLLNEPDPVRVVDARSRRLMTERDVIALANLHRFARSDGAPRHEPLSKQQVEQLAAALRAAVGGNSGNMPRFYSEAATFWAGVQLEWPRLSADQRSLVRAYAGRTWRVQMSVEMYGRLWGLEPQAASARRADDVSARLAAITDINMRLGNLPRVMDAIFGP